MILSIGYSTQIIVFFFQALEPPREEAIASAISLLYEVPIIFTAISYFSYLMDKVYFFGAFLV